MTACCSCSWLMNFPSCVLDLEANFRCSKTLAGWWRHVSLLGNIFPDILLLPQARQHQFHAIGNSELIKDAEEVILHRVLGKSELLPDFSIGKAFHGQANDFRLSLGHAALHVRIHLALLGRFREGVEHVS